MRFVRFVRFVRLVRGGFEFDQRLSSSPPSGVCKACARVRRFDSAVSKRPPSRGRSDPLLLLFFIHDEPPGLIAGVEGLLEVAPLARCFEFVLLLLRGTERRCLRRLDN